MENESLDAHQRALRINLDGSMYGTFAEIGAGQETARWFFRVGGAAGTMAKAMSAYDMTFSDAIYGTCDRYVSRERLHTMLEREFRLLVERLDAKRGSTTTFFAFANTCAVSSYSRKGNAQGWLGIRFQTQPGAAPSEIVVHVRLWHRESLLEQEALGILGVNLVHGALYQHQDPEALIVSLADNFTADHVEIDMIDFSGPAFEGVDNRLMALKLVQHGRTHAALFTADGEVAPPGDVLRKKCILVERGSFRPVTNLTMEMLLCARAHFAQEPQVAGQDVVTLMEMTLKNLTDGDRIDHQDFLDRVDILGALDKTVLISNYAEYHRLAAYFFRYTEQMIGIVMGVPTLREVFNDKYYTDLSGGILESFGRLFKHDLKLYVHPLLDPHAGALISATNLRVEPHLRHLHAYLVENRLIQGLRDIDERNLPIFSRDVLAKIKSGEAGWEDQVPDAVAGIIKDRGLLGYRRRLRAIPA